MSGYIGRFAPSPTGPLHAGSLCCALASYLDARAHQGTWVIRIEDIDPPREPPGTAKHQLEVLKKFGLKSDREVLFQSQRHHAYELAFENLRKNELVYGCSCSRQTIAIEQERLGLPKNVYPGTCRKGTKEPVRAWRFRTSCDPISFTDRRFGIQSQNVEKSVGDFVLKRADGFWAYQLAVVVDDAFQGITHVVRGADLLDNTARQIALQRALGYPTPSYFHVDLVLNNQGQKLSKQTQAPALDTNHVDKELLHAWKNLGFVAFEANSLDDFYKEATKRWAERYLS